MIAILIYWIMFTVASIMWFLEAPLDRYSTATLFHDMSRRQWRWLGYILFVAFVIGVAWSLAVLPQ